MSRHPGEGLVRAEVSGGDDTQFPPSLNTGAKNGNGWRETVLKQDWRTSWNGRRLVQQPAKGWHGIPGRGVMQLARAVVVPGTMIAVAR
jgi:hypothetical protein